MPLLKFAGPGVEKFFFSFFFFLNNFYFLVLRLTLDTNRVKSPVRSTYRCRIFVFIANFPYIHMCGFFSCKISIIALLGFQHTSDMYFFLFDEFLCVHIGAYAKELDIIRNFSISTSCDCFFYKKHVVWKNQC